MTEPGVGSSGGANAAPADAVDVIVVDDDPASARILEALLLSDGCRVRSFSDGQAALDAMLAGPPDVLISDWVMPGLDGPDLLKKVRATPALQSTYCVLVTAHDDRGRKVTGLLVGADDYLTKPVSKTELLARIRVGMRVRKLERRTMLLAAGVTLGHEVNNPLTAVLGYVDLLRDQIRKGEKDGAIQSLDRIGEAAERIRAVVARFVAAEDPRTKEYLPGTRMLDLGPEMGAKPPSP